MILRKLGFSVLMLGLALPAWSADRPGYDFRIRARAPGGIPQMGADGGSAGRGGATASEYSPTRTDFYSAAGLLPGVYNLRVSAPAFLPALREHVGLHRGVNTIVNVTLNTLFEAIQITPAHGGADEDDWKWVLRSVPTVPFCGWLTINSRYGRCGRIRKRPIAS